MTEKVSKSLDEKYYVIDHKSGLKIYVMLKKIILQPMRFSALTTVLLIPNLSVLIKMNGLLYRRV